MIADGSSLPSLKRKRLPAVDSLDTEAAAAKVKLAIKAKFRRDLCVFEMFCPPPTQVSKGGEILKTRKIQEAKESAHKSRIRKVVIRVRFPDKDTLEVAFPSSEKIQSLLNLLKKVVARPELPFYILKKLSEILYSGGFSPGAIVYFSYDLQRGDDAAAIYSGPFLREEVMALKGLNVISESAACSVSNRISNSNSLPFSSRAYAW
ncbi:hypothetical protein POPTR_001G337533v4 [Populus trichocarpa]|uniref:Uncharacterized protein n=1 Tax=Populus trichocarpa TaxID=3694 RepID=A0ACC0TNP2_POPTR|nr:hypothetical protein POPTR_001G337533v4 [Populus trichocarpa]